MMTKKEAKIRLSIEKESSAFHKENISPNLQQQKVITKDSLFKKAVSKVAATSALSAQMQLRSSLQIDDLKGGPLKEAMKKMNQL